MAVDLDPAWAAAAQPPATAVILLDTNALIWIERRHRRVRSLVRSFSEFPVMDGQCRCDAIGPGVQTFRLRHPADLFDFIVTLEGIAKEMIDSRAVWACRDCGQHFAWLRILYKDHEEIIVRAQTSDWRNWDWRALAAVADSCRWRGPEREARYVL